VTERDAKNRSAGTIAYQNWRAARAGEPAGDTYEYPLFSDALVQGEVRDGLGPYSVLNALPGFPIDPLAPVMVLRLTNHLHIDPGLGPDTDDSAYHGGTATDEIAALLSLHLGIRLKAGAQSRWFKVGGDPLGSPENLRFANNPVAVRSSFPIPIPRLRKDVTIGASEPRLTQFPTIPVKDAVAIVRAARLFQEGVWVAEVDGSFAWLMLVSAIETAAGRWRRKKDTPRARMAAAKPELEKLLVEQGGEALADEAAQMLRDSFGATKTFCEFCFTFLPDPPLPRPSSGERLEWTAEDMAKPLKQIYDYRSRALHAGKPFPLPMSFTPREINGAYAERMLGGSVGTRGSTWAAKDLPMTLHAFEHLARGALLKWWDSLATAAASETDARSAGAIDAPPA
jgi:hypothetical protein